VGPKTGIITTLAGTSQPGFGGDGGPAEKAAFDFVMCVTLNPAQDKLHVASLKNRRIREVDLKTKIVRTMAGNGRQGVPQDGDQAVAADSRGNGVCVDRG